MCCSARDKNERAGRSLPNAPQFRCTEVEVQLSSPTFLAYAPIWHREGLPVRRLAMASESQVHVYRMFDDVGAPTDTPQFVHEFAMTLASDQVVTGLVFSEETHSRSLAVAFSVRQPQNNRAASASGSRSSNANGASTAPSGGPAATAAAGSPRASQTQAGSSQHCVRVWACELPPGARPRHFGDGQDPVVWSPSSGFAASLEGHLAPIYRLAVSPSFLLSADNMGACCVWQKNRNFARRAASLLHKGGIADIAIDRLFAYSAGKEDRCISAWSVPDLTPILSITTGVAEAFLSTPLSEAASSSLDKDQKRRACCGSTTHLGLGAGQAAPRLPAKGPPPTPRCRISRLTAIRLPLSRWAGTQGSSGRSAKAPRGSLFFAGVLGEACPAGPAGSGVVVQYLLGEELSCKSAQVGHDTPVVAMAYGPYDNGPLITADAHGTFRVWDTVPGLNCSQQVSLAIPEVGGFVAIGVEPQVGLYLTVGDQRLFLWRRHQLHDVNGSF